MPINTLLTWLRLSLLVLVCFGGSYYFTHASYARKRAAKTLPTVDYRLSAVPSRVAAPAFK
jgi:hypothetical protein